MGKSVPDLIETIMIRISPAMQTCVIAVAILLATLSPPSASIDGGQLSVSDKLLHALAFGALVLPATWSQFRNALWIAPLALIFGGLIELLQPMVGRSAEWADFFADIAGIALALLPGSVRHHLKK